MSKRQIKYIIIKRKTMKEKWIRLTSDDIRQVLAEDEI